MNIEKTKIPSISVVIPVKDEAKTLKACIQGILDQTIPVVEIVVIDSGSTDGTQELAQSFPQVKLIEIEPKEFNHGDTRNLGVKESKGDYILFTVGDAKPINSRWIEKLLLGFSKGNIAAVCGSQVVEPIKQTNPAEWFKEKNVPDIITFSFESPEGFDQAPVKERKSSSSWDDVSALYKRIALEKLPFRKIVYGEDVMWAIDAYKAGFTLAYSPAARVYHFHLNNYQTILKRTIAVSYLRYTALEFIPPKYNALKMFIRNVRRLSKQDNLSWGDKLFWIRYNYSAVRAHRAGLMLFQRAVDKGPDELTKLHEKFCGSPPLPVKR